MNLSLVKQAKFNGINCDFYNSCDNNQIWMTRDQIGRALNYKDPRVAISKIHTAHSDRLDMFSTVTKAVTVEGARKVEREVFIYSAKGVYEICRWSRQPNADAFMDFVWDIVESLRTGKAVLLNNGSSDTQDFRKIIREEFKSIMYELFSQYQIPQLTLPVSLEAESDYLRYRSGDNDQKQKRRHYSIDTLKCKPGIIQLYLSGAKLKQIVEYVAEQGEFCSIASLSRYFRNKFRLARKNTDGSIELVEKNGGTVLYCRDGTQYIKSGKII